MRKFVPSLFAVLVLLLLLFGLGASCAEAQRPTRVYGSAYSYGWSGRLQWSPATRVQVQYQGGPVIEAGVDRLGDWWLDNMPSNRSYRIRAIETFSIWLGPMPDRYGDWTDWCWVPERGRFQFNQTRLPDAIVWL